MVLTEFLVSMVSLIYFSAKVPHPYKAMLEPRKLLDFGRNPISLNFDQFLIEDLFDSHDRLQRWIGF